MRTKVIVIGSGGAGLTAAISAANHGAEVCLLSKTGCGLNTATYVSGGVFTLASGSVTPEQRYEKIMEVGRNLNDPALVGYLAGNALGALEEIASWGVGVRFPKDGMASVRHTATHKFAGGEGMTAQLVGVAKALGVEFLPYTAVTKILCGESDAEGVRAVDWRKGLCRDIFADAVVIATGGAGQIFSRTDNPSRLTGDGYALALDLGLELRDMEFTQFYPMGWKEKRLPVWMADLSLIDYAPLTDADGSEFMLEALHDWGYASGNEGNFYARDRAAALIAQKDAQGGAFFHLESIREEQWGTKAVKNALILNSGIFKKLKRPVRVAPIHHYFCGGIRTDAETRTAIPGLFACGESMGGIDGANRIGGNSLAGIVTFGLSAGRNAARTGPHGAESKPDLPVNTSFGREDGSAPAEARAELQSEMWECLGPIRSKAGITRALEFLDAQEERELRVATPKDLLEALEMPSLIKTARAVAVAALARKESCGTHFRTD